jgi:hypothetical protein
VCPISTAMGRRLRGLLKKFVNRWAMLVLKVHRQLKLKKGTVHEGVPGTDGEMDVRIMDGQANGGKYKGPRVITSNSKNKKDPVKTNGEKFRNNESKGERRQKSHIQLEKGK